MARKPRAPKKSTTKKSASKVASGTTEVSFSKQNVVQKASDIEKAEKAKAKTQKVLFKLKLKMFEQDAVKESDNSAIVKTLKKEIRTSKTPLEALVIYSELIK